MSKTLGDLVRRAKSALERADIDDPAREARSLAGLAADVPSARVSLSLDTPVSDKADARLREFLAARAVRVPLSHITGSRAFYKHDFRVTPDVLDPRPETETLVEAALTQPFDHLLDLGTGSGCILVSLLAERPQSAGVGTDISPEALRIAAANAEDLQVSDRCLLLCSDWFDAVEGRFDLIVANPPYIAADEIAGLAPELSHEPRGALTDEGDGLSAYRAIVPGATEHLHLGGRLLVEIGWQQGATVRDLFAQSGFSDITIMHDLDGRDRVVGGNWT